MNQITSIDCGEILDISGVRDMHEKLKTSVSNNDQLILDAGNVERADSAALQMMVALFRDSSVLGISTKWNNPSQSLINSAKILGLEKILEL